MGLIAAQPQLPVVPDITPANPVPHPRNTSHPLVEDLKNLALEGLGKRFDSMFQGASEVLIGLSEKSESAPERHNYFESMRVLELEQPRMTRSFQHQIARAFGASAPVLPATSDVCMAQMSAQELEESIALSSMASKAKTRYRELLADLDSRLKRLERDMGLPPAQRALTPRRFCEAYCACLDGIDPGYSVRKILLQLFDRMVLEELAGTYEDILAMLNHHSAGLELKADPIEARSGPHDAAPEASVESVHRVVTNELRALTTGRRLHPGVQRFLCSGMAPLMSVRLLRYGMHSKLWGDCLDRTSHLLHSFEPHRREPEVIVIRREYLDAISADLGEIGIRENKLRALISGLESAYAALDSNVASMSPSAYEPYLPLPDIEIFQRATAH